MKAIGIPDFEKTWTSTTGYSMFDTPEPNLDEKADPSDASAVILEMIAAGFCGSDRSVWHRKAFGSSISQSLKLENAPNRIAGHELLGRVVAMGSLAERNSGLKIGDTVASESHIFCGQCYQCRLGQQNVCSNEKIIGISAPGCFAPKMKIPFHTLWKTDLNKIRWEVAAIQEPFGNAVHACSKVDLRGKVVAIFGCGAIGLMCVLIARALGAGKIIGIDISPMHLNLALEAGADAAIQVNAGAEKWSSDPALKAKIMDLTNHIGVDAALEMSGANSGVNNCINITRRGGDIVLFGLQSGEFRLESYETLVVNGLAMHSVIGRELFRTWNITKNLLESEKNGIQQRVFDVVLSGGRGSIADFSGFDTAGFEKLMAEHTKLVFSIKGV